MFKGLSGQSPGEGLKGGGKAGLREGRGSSGVRAQVLATEIKTLSPLFPQEQETSPAAWLLSVRGKTGPWGLCSRHSLSACLALWVLLLTAVSGHRRTLPPRLHLHWNFRVLGAAEACGGALTFRTPGSHQLISCPVATSVPTCPCFSTAAGETVVGKAAVCSASAPSAGPNGYEGLS